MKDSIHLEAILAINSFATVIWVFKRFPLLGIFQYLLVPLTKLLAYMAMVRTTRESVLRRISRKGNTPHPDYFDHVLPTNKRVTKIKSELTHIGAIAQQVMFAGSGPMSDWFYGALFFLLEELEYCKILNEEVRERFEKYQDILPGALNELPYLHAVLEESLRMLPQNNTGLPRLSSGSRVDGVYVSKGVCICISPPPLFLSSLNQTTQFQSDSQT